MRNMNFFYDLTAKYAASSKPYKRQLAYLESTGTQYIDTGIAFDTTLDMEATVRAAVVNAGRSVIFGSYYALSYNSFELEWGGTINNHPYTPRAYVLPGGRIAEAWDGTQTMNSPVDITLAYAASDASVVMTVGETSYATGATPGTKLPYGNLLMFLDHRSDPTIIANGNRIYSLSFTKNGVLVRDFIPVLDWNDVPCMYDKVSKQLFYNQGTRQFLYPMTDDDSFTLDITLTSDNLQFGVIPYWNTGGYCNVEWGDGTTRAATTSGTALTHTYAETGDYHIRVRGGMYRFRVGSTNPAALIDCNGNWEALGNITNGREMFRSCTNATLSFNTLPSDLTDGWAMFYGCEAAQLPLNSLPSNLQTTYYMFATCKSASLPLTSLPDTVTSGSYMFSDCTTALLPLTKLPDGLTSGSNMFSGCKNARLPLTKLPDGLLYAVSMFYECQNAELPLTGLPNLLTSISLMFGNCYNATLPIVNLPRALAESIALYGAFSHCEHARFSLDSLATYDGVWPGVSSIAYAYQYVGTANTPGTVTGSIANFMRKFPNATTVDGAFLNTNTTTFGTSDYFEIVLTTTEANQSWGFTPTLGSTYTGTWYCYDWGDNTPVTRAKNLATFTSGTKISHTFATPGTYHIKLATAPCTIVFDPYDSDNGNYASLGQ